MCQDNAVETVVTVDEKNAERRGKTTAIHKRKLGIAVGVAACVGLLICVILLCSVRTFSAEEVYYLFSDLMGCPKTAYGMVQIENDQQLTLNPVPFECCLPIYAQCEVYVDLDQKEFTGFIDGILSSLSNSLGAEIPQYTVENNSELIQNTEIQMAQYNVRFSQIAKQDLAYSVDTPLNTFGLYRGTAKTITLEGKPLQTVFTEDEEANLRYVSSIKEKVFRMIGRSFSDVRFFSSYDRDNGYARLSVCFYNKKDHPLRKNNALLNDTDYVHVNFVSEYTNGETEKPITINCSDIRYTQYRVRPLEQYPLTGIARRVSVSEAEKLLKEGYVFSGTQCCICARNDPEVDFSEYDHVELTYIDGPVKGTKERIFIPFYRFYKLQRIDEDGTKIYATATVPAVEVDGLAEYAEEYAQKVHPYHNA